MPQTLSSCPTFLPALSPPPYLKLFPHVWGVTPSEHSNLAKSVQAETTISQPGSTNTQIRLTWWFAVGYHVISRIPEPHLFCLTGQTPWEPLNVCDWVSCSKKQSATQSYMGCTSKMSISHKMTKNTQLLWFPKQLNISTEMFVRLLNGWMVT